MGTPSLDTIGISFVLLYYKGLNSNPEKCSSFYSKKAEFVHVNFNEPTETINEPFQVTKLKGKDAIKKYLKSNKDTLKSSKLKINTSDCQKLGSTSDMLLLITGQIFWEETPVYNFVQTFVLSAVDKEEQHFEISNTIFKITRSSQTQSEKQSGTPNVVKPTEDVANLDSSNNRSAVVTPEELGPNQLYFGTGYGASPYVPSGVQSGVQYPAQYNWNTPYYSQNPNEYNQIYPGYNAQKFQYYGNQGYNGVSSENGYKNNKYAARKGSYNGNNSNSSFTSKRASHYSIYVSNTNDVPEFKLKQKLEEKVGPILKVTTFENYTVVDFEKLESISKCLSIKQIDVDGIKINFEKKLPVKNETPNVTEKTSKSTDD